MLVQIEPCWGVWIWNGRGKVGAKIGRIFPKINFQFTLSTMLFSRGLCNCVCMCLWWNVIGCWADLQVELAPTKSVCACLHTLYNKNCLPQHATRQHFGRSIELIVISLHRYTIQRATKNKHLQNGRYSNMRIITFLLVFRDKKCYYRRTLYVRREAFHTLTWRLLVCARKYWFIVAVYYRRVC